MHSIEIYETGKKLFIPEDLSECDPRQYIEMSELILLYQSGLIDYDMLLIQSVYKLLNMVPVNSKLHEDQENKMDNISNIAQLINSFFEGEETKTIKQEYVHNPVPSYRPILTKYYGPTEMFMNVTFDEYRDGLRLFYQFNADHDISNLYDLCAIFYRPKKRFHFIKKLSPSYDGDIREPYNSFSVEKRAEKFKKYPIGFVYGFYLFFASFQKFISTARIPWAGKEIDLSIVFESDGDEKNPQHPGIGMDSLFFSMAESQVFGDTEKLGKRKLWDILIRMYDMRVKDLELKQQQENAKRK
jgi:hypothetical protein